jgi:hypothetical protein
MRQTRPFGCGKAGQIEIPGIAESGRESSPGKWLFQIFGIHIKNSCRQIR